MKEVAQTYWTVERPFVRLAVQLTETKSVHKAASNWDPFSCTEMTFTATDLAHFVLKVCLFSWLRVHSKQQKQQPNPNSTHQGLCECMPISYRLTVIIIIFSRNQHRVLLARNPCPLFLSCNNCLTNMTTTNWNEKYIKKVKQLFTPHWVWGIFRDYTFRACFRRMQWEIKGESERDWCTYTQSSDRTQH